MSEQTCVPAMYSPDEMIKRLQESVERIVQINSRLEAENSMLMDVIAERDKRVAELEAENAKLKTENDDYFYKMAGVMHSVDKWLDGEELEQDEANRAATMREKTLRIAETLQAEVSEKGKRIAELEDELKRTEKKWMSSESDAITLHGKFSESEIENARLKAERDAAAADIKDANILDCRGDGTPVYSIRICEYCAKNKTAVCDCDTQIGSKFEHRGVRDGENSRIEEEN